jgi:hypothetical protein
LGSSRGSSLVEAERRLLEQVTGLAHDLLLDLLRGSRDVVR